MYLIIAEDGDVFQMKHLDEETVETCKERYIDIIRAKTDENLEIVFEMYLENTWNEVRGP